MNTWLTLLSQFRNDPLVHVKWMRGQSEIAYDWLMQMEVSHWLEWYDTHVRLVTRLDVTSYRV